MRHLLTFALCIPALLDVLQKSGNAFLIFKNLSSGKGGREKEKGREGGREGRRVKGRMLNRR